jgi:hypothetical protein
MIVSHLAFISSLIYNAIYIKRDGERFGSLLTHPTTDTHLRAHGATTNPPVRWNDTQLWALVGKSTDEMSV